MPRSPTGAWPPRGPPYAGRTSTTPVQNAGRNHVVSLTVVGPTIFEADRLATAAFAMGRPGLPFAARSRIRSIRGRPKGRSIHTAGFDQVRGLSDPSAARTGWSTGSRCTGWSSGTSSPCSASPRSSAPRRPGLLAGPLLRNRATVGSRVRVDQRAFRRVFEAPLNDDSAVISGLILALIAGPASSPTTCLPRLGRDPGHGIKYVIAWRHIHLFNPVAIALVLTGLFADQSASWWIAVRRSHPT